MSIYHYFIDYFNESPFIIQVVWTVIFLFIILIIFLTLYFRNLRKSLRIKERIIAVYEKKYESYLLNYLYAESEENVNSQQQKVVIDHLKKSTKNPFIRKILISLLVKLKNEISGEIALSIEKLYFQADLTQYALARLKHKKWYVIAKGIRELKNFHVKEAYGAVMLHINHPRREVRKEMQLYMVNLFYFEGLSFLDLLEMQLSEWDQIQLLGALQRLENQDIPNIKSWLKSSNDSVILFALKLAEIYNVIETKEEIINLLNHTNKYIRLEAIQVSSNFYIPEAKEILKINIENRSIDEKIAIFKMFENLYDFKDESFLIEHATNEIFEIKVSVLKILKKLNNNFFIQLKLETTDAQFLRIINFIENN